MSRVVASSLNRFLAGALSALAFAGAALAQPVPTAALDRLAEKAARQGTVRVLVGVPVATKPEGRLGGPAAMVQRSSIRSAQQSAMSELSAAPGARIHAVFERVPHFAAEVDANTLARLRNSPNVRSIEEDVAVPPTLLQSTANIGAGVPWAAGRNGSGWVVAVLDTGVDKNHPFLAGKVVSEACYSTTSGGTSTSVCPGGVSSSTAAGSGLNCNTAIAGCTHGTHVAGIVAGSGAADGSQGVAPGAGILAIQVFSHFPAQGGVMSYTSDQIRGLERVYALKDSFQIASVNMSLGGGQYAATCDAEHSAIKAAIDNLRSVGIATVIAAGNNGWRNALSAPACVSSAISVGATCDAGPDGGACATGVGGVASYSNITPFVSLLAPGSYITSSVPGTGYVAQNGTSMAAPHVAGAWALLKHAQPTIGVSEGLTLLRDNGVAMNDTRAGGVSTDLRRIQLGFLSGTAHTLSVSRAGSGTGSVSSAPNGIGCGNDCSQAYAEGTTVTLNPTAGAYSSFAGWSGDCSGVGACTLTMSADRNVTASFNATPFALTVTRAGTGSGTVSSSTGGVNCGSSCMASIAGGSTVTLTATPSTGSTFAAWSGACTGTASTCTVSMTAARTVTASFTLQSFATTISRSGTGAGTVTSSPVGIACGTTCAVTRPYGSTMVLTATPAVGSAFAGWSGACSGTGTCTVTVNGASTVGAVFTQTNWPLTVTKTGLGTVASDPAGINCGTVCGAQMPVASTVTLSATPAAGYYLVGWGGACSGNASSCTVSMGAARTVSASFAQITHVLSVTPGGDGAGVVSSNPAGISCGTACTKAWIQGTTVTLAAKATTGSVFAGWTGACSGTAATCTVSMSQARSVGATFTRTHWSLATVNAGTGAGSVAWAPGPIVCGATCSALLPLGSSVSLTPTAAAESAFAGWSGACTGVEGCTVTMDAAKSVTANFARTHFTLTATRAGGGSGVVSSADGGIDCGSSCKRSIPIGTSVTLSATPATGSRFTGWSGACAGVASTCTVSMSAARTVTANFALMSYGVTVTRGGSGVGTVTSNPVGLNCGATCTVAKNYGSSMTLSAVPAAGSVFAGWTGACSGTAPCTVTVTQAMSVGAEFARTHWPLTVTRGGTGIGSVASDPVAINCGTVCSQLRPVGGQVVLNATPVAESAFTGWSGACSGTDNCTVTMDAAKTVAATFTRTHFTLNTIRAGTGSGVVSSSDGSIDCGSNCSRSIAVGTAVTLSAAPAIGSRFTGWSGACTGTASTCTVSMSAARTVTASFVLQSYGVTVTRSGSGVGTVVSNPIGLNCGTTCSVAKNYGSSLTLTATPAAGSVFAGWTGACSGTGPCAVTVTQAVAVGAEFTRTQWPLAVARNGTGTGTVVSTPDGIACGSSCSQMRSVGEQLVLSATPAAETAFSGWSGACSGTADCAVTMDAAKSATATFTRTHWTLSATRAGTGSGTVSAAAVGLDCGSTCSRSVPIGTSVTLTATPALYSRFTGWTGACTGTATTCTLSMTAARAVTATFQPIVYAMTVTKSGSGTVSSTPVGLSCGTTCSRAFNGGTGVTLSAVPAAGWRFTGWGGACSGTDACSVTIDAAKTVSASFVTP